MAHKIRVSGATYRLILLMHEFLRKNGLEMSTDRMIFEGLRCLRRTVCEMKGGCDSEEMEMFLPERLRKMIRELEEHGVDVTVILT